MKNGLKIPIDGWPGLGVGVTVSSVISGIIICVILVYSEQKELVHTIAFVVIIPGLIALVGILCMLFLSRSDKKEIMDKLDKLDVIEKKLDILYEIRDILKKHFGNNDGIVGAPIK